MFPPGLPDSNWAQSLSPKLQIEGGEAVIFQVLTGATLNANGHFSYVQMLQSPSPFLVFANSCFLCTTNTPEPSPVSNMGGGGFSRVVDILGRHILTILVEFLWLKSEKLVANNAHGSERKQLCCLSGAGWEGAISNFGCFVELMDFARSLFLLLSNILSYSASKEHSFCGDYHVGV